MSGQAIIPGTLAIGMAGIIAADITDTVAITVVEGTTTKVFAATAVGIRPSAVGAAQDKENPGWTFRPTRILNFRPEGKN